MSALPTDHLEDARNLDRARFIQRYSTHYEIEILRRVLIEEYGITRVSIGNRKRKALAGQLYDLIEEASASDEVVSEIDDDIWDFRFHTVDGMNAGKRAIQRKFSRMPEPEASDKLRRILVCEFGIDIGELNDHDNNELIDRLADELAEFHRIVYDNHTPPASQNVPDEEDDGNDEGTRTTATRR